MKTADVAPLLRYYIDSSDCVDMRNYGRNFLDHLSRALQSARQMMQLGRMRSARVLDLGCGFGWYAVAVSLLGDNTVVANDIRVLMIENIERQLSRVADKFDVRPRVTPFAGDFVDLPVESSSFDAIFCNQTIEHLRDLRACFQKAFRVLRPGGTLVIANDNNSLTRAHLAAIEKMWIDRDTSWPYIEALKKERPEENKDIKPYAVMRGQIIRAACPALDEQVTECLIAATAGQTSNEIVESVRRFGEDGTVPQRPRYSWCRNPVTGEYCERQFDPFALKLQLHNTGFRVRLLQDIRRGGPLRISTRIDIPLLNRMLFRYRSRFVLVARRPPV